MGNGSYYTFKDNKFEIKKVTMDVLARLLERYVDRPLLNLSGLDGQYDLTVAVTEDDYRTMLIRAAVNSGVAGCRRRLCSFWIQGRSRRCWMGCSNSG